MEPSHPSETLHSLSRLHPGTDATVCALEGGHDFKSRVANLGFTIGATLRVVQNYGRGPMIVNVRGTLVALGREEASKVLVDGSVVESESNHDVP